jgi:hypothetical protein
MCTTIHRVALISLSCLGFSAAHADQITVDGTTIERVVVNGGTDHDLLPRGVCGKRSGVRFRVWQEH